MKKIILAAAGIITLGLFIFFFGRGYVINEWEYRFDSHNNEIEITGYNGRASELVLPSELLGIPVKSVHELKFSHSGIKDKVKSLVIPDPIDRIYDSFSDMPALEHVEMGNSVSSILAGSFANCDSLTDITLPASIERIGTFDAAQLICPFMNCKSLGKVSFDETKVELTGCCFEGTPWIEELRNGEPYAVLNGKVIGGGKAEGKLVIDNGDIVERMSFVRNEKLSEVLIRSNISSVGFAAFYNCPGLVKVELENGVGTINDLAFSKCSSLVITIPSSVTKIEKNAIDKSATIMCSEGSAALSYAQENNIKYEILK